MHTKIILVAIIFLMGGFFYLHEINPQSADLILDKAVKFNLPVAAIVAIGFVFGVLLMVLNSLSVDLKRSFNDFKIRREQKKQNISEDKHRRGVEELLKDNSDKAVLFLEKAHFDSPDDVDIVLHLASAYVKDGNFKEALKVLRSSLKINGNKLEILFAIHDCAVELNDTQSAEKALDDILRVDEKNKVAMTKLRDMAVENENWQRALGCQEMMLNLKLKGKELAEEKTTMAGILHELALEGYGENNIEDALVYLTRALKVDSAFIPAYVLRSILQTVDGKIFESKKTLLKSVDKFGDPACYVFLEDLLMSEGTPDEMLEVYSKGIEKSPGDVELRILSARFFLRLEMVDEAMEALEKIYYSEDQGFYVKALLAEAYSRRDLKEKALNLLKQSLDFEKELSPHFICSNCQHNSNEWTARCVDCGRWNSSHMNRESIYGNSSNKTKKNIEKIKN